jgi:release factor glutamine methyltransferase
MVYSPREDSYMLEEAVHDHAYGKCLDMGTGSGILAKAAERNAAFVVALDIDENAIKEARKFLGPTILCEKSDLFDYFEEKKYIKNKQFSRLLSDLKFDTIIFNPPYLPDDKRVKDVALDGGKKGTEVLEKFFAKVNAYLAEKGIVLIVFSSLTNKAKVDEIIENYMMVHEEIAVERIFFEELYVYKVQKSELLIELERKGVDNISYLARGRRGIVFTGTYKGMKVAVKTKKKQSEAIGRMQNEANWLKALNKKGIGPKFLFSGKEYLVYRFIKGKFITDYVDFSTKKEILTTLKDIFKQLYIMDKMQLDKEEMHHPFKHIIVGKKPVMIDFERCHKTLTPKNITQFCQFIISKTMSLALKKKGIIIDRKKIIMQAKQYKKDYKQHKFI